MHLWRRPLSADGATARGLCVPLPRLPAFRQRPLCRWRHRFTRRIRGDRGDGLDGPRGRKRPHRASVCLPLMRLPDLARSCGWTRHHHRSRRYARRSGMGAAGSAHLDAQQAAVGRYRRCRGIPRRRPLATVPLRGVGCLCERTVSLAPGAENGIDHQRHSIFLLQARVVRQRAPRIEAHGQRQRRFALCSELATQRVVDRTQRCVEAQR